MHDDGRVVLSNLRDAFDQACRQIELAALPVTRQVLRSLLDRAVALDDTGTGDPDEGRELESLLVRLRDEVPEHLDETFHRRLTARLVVGMAP